MRNICKTVVLPASAGELYEMYMDPRVHGEFTGAPAKICEEPGSPFEAFGGLVSGTTLQVVRHRLIVQSWRSVNFAKTDPNSTLIISFTPEDEDGRIDLVHVNVPASDYQGVSGGWDSRYFSPWLDYLRSRRT
ncbi:MAG TPA: SRPBCC domain-containing protein [Woeseiaceae bacterium]|nr:SRPBCC domain-containing protein [Woeseiaceae bacterium]